MIKIYRGAIGDLKNLTDAEKGYLAGALDGEGFLSIYKDKQGNSHVCMGISNTDEQFIKYVRTRMGGKHYTISPKGRLGNKSCFHVRLNRREQVISLLKILLPYLLIKKETALKILDWDRDNPPIFGSREYRERMSKAIKQKWRDPIYKNKMLAGQREKVMIRWYKNREPIENNAEAIFREHQLGENFSQLARKYGCSSSTIRRVLDRYKQSLFQRA
jgi:hypothetical protein